MPFIYYHRKNPVKSNEIKTVYMFIQSQKISYDIELILIVNAHVITRIKTVKVLDYISKVTG